MSRVKKVTHYKPAAVTMNNHWDELSPPPSSNWECQRYKDEHAVQRENNRVQSTYAFGPPKTTTDIREVTCVDCLDSIAALALNRINYQVFVARR
jgi:hypothetical protein